MRKRYKLFCTLSTNVADKEAYNEIEFTTSRNLPRNILEESQTAKNLEGVVSKETQLKTLSIVNNVKDEIERMNKEQEEQEKRMDQYSFADPAINDDKGQTEGLNDGQ